MIKKEIFNRGIYYNFLFTQSNQFLKLISVCLLLIIISFNAISINKCNLQTPCIVNLQQVIRGLEIRYVVLEDKKILEKKEIIIEGVTYNLFKTREDAIETTKYSNLKKDYTIVYVISDKKRATEIISISDTENQ